MNSHISINNELLGKLTRYFLFSIILIGIITVPITRAGTNQTNMIDLKHELPQLPSDGQELFLSWYRGIDKNYVPNPSDSYDLRYQYWDSIQNIKSGFELLNTISDLCSCGSSLFNLFVYQNNHTKDILLQNILNERTDKKDFWFSDFDTSIDAYTLIDAIDAENMTISEVDDLLNNTFQLYDYFNSVASGTINVNGTQVPAWTKVTLKCFIYAFLKNFFFIQSLPSIFDNV